MPRNIVVRLLSLKHMPDENDIVYEGYQIDFVYIGRSIFDMFGFDGFSFQPIVQTLGRLWEIWTVLSLIISALLIIFLIYVYIRNSQLGELENEWIETQERLYKELYGKENADSRWTDIEKHIASDNPNDWKLAIIEADVILEEALESAGYAGLTIGEKLKSASPSNFKTLDEAWKAHKVRNQIAHGGADFVLTKKVAQETLVFYRRVFTELGIV